MGIEQKEIIDAIEYSLTGGVYAIIFPSIDYWEFNRIGMTRLTEENSDDTIKRVLDEYFKKNLKSICWVFSPQTTPSNLATFLEANNFHKRGVGWGMSRSVNIPLENSPPEEFEFRELPLEELKNPEIQKMIEEAYGMPEGAGALFYPFTKMFEKITDICLYVAYKDQKPIAFGNLFKVPDTRIGLLGGAATLPEFRKRGIYTGMLYYRTEKAKEFGIEELIIQANEKTSAPVALKNGFTKLCELLFYVWEDPSNQVSESK
ncbi:MAG: GNAT family N-acetyltransferase [Candidatus Kariarchaeaceae archaeon]|jgi:hypothetical protein